jgi:hypothetical protein
MMKVVAAACAAFAFVALPVEAEEVKKIEHFVMLLMYASSRPSHLRYGLRAGFGSRRHHGETSRSVIARVQGEPPD